MRERYTVDSQFETEPTGNRLAELLPQVVSQLKTRETVATDGVASESEIRPIVSRDDERYFVTVQSEYGQQEDGFLIDVEVEGRDGFSREDAQEILRSLEASVKRVFDVTQKTR